MSDFSLVIDTFLVDWPGGSWQNTLKIAGAILGVYLFAIYLASIYWSYRDIRQRTRDPIAQLVGVLLVVVLFLPGIWIYMILRPRHTLVELYERSLEEEALLQELDDQKACPNCRRRVEDEYIVCPTCRMALKDPCPSCGKPLNHSWLVCPYCGADKAPALAAPRRTYVAEPAYRLEEEYGEEEPWERSRPVVPGTRRSRRRAPVQPASEKPLLEQSGNGRSAPQEASTAWQEDVEAEAPRWDQAESRGPAEPDQVTQDWTAVAAERNRETEATREEAPARNQRAAEERPDRRERSSERRERTQREERPQRPERPRMQLGLNVQRPPQQERRPEQES